MDKINPNNKIIRKENALFTRMDNELVMMDMDKGLYFGLNSTGADLWSLISHPIKLSDILIELSKKYKCSQDVYKVDVIKFFLALEKNGLIEIKK